MTPDRVDTRIGVLEYTDGFPTEATAQLLYDHLDLLRGVEVFLSGVPAASLEAMRIGMEDVGITACHQVGILDRLSQVDAPPAMEFISLSEREFNTIHANDVSFFDEGRTSSQRRELVTLRAGHPLKPWFLILNVRQSGLA